MTAHRPAHPLDVDLADLLDGALDAARVASVEAHLAGCVLCRAKLDRLERASPGIGPEPLAGTAALPTVSFVVPDRSAGPVSPGDLRLAGQGEGEQVMVVVRRVDGGRALVAPATFDVDTADEETVVLEASESPLGLGLAVHPTLSTELPIAALGDRLASLPATALDAGGRRGAPITDASDPRLEVRQHLADCLASLDEREPDLGGGVDAPLPRPEQLRSSLIADLRALRGDTCAVRPLFGWGDVLPADQTAGWEPLVVLDELGVVLVVFDTPHGLTDDDDYSRARTVLTRLNGTALVVLASAVTDLADVFDAPSLHHGIEAPSGRVGAPRPLISDLAPFDAIGKFLDRTTGLRATTPQPRGPVTRVDVGDILREAAAAALADAVRLGGRFKIAPKRRGYESLADVEQGFAAALGAAFDADSMVVEALIALVRKDDE